MSSIYDAMGRQVSPKLALGISAWGPRREGSAGRGCPKKLKESDAKQANLRPNGRRGGWGAEIHSC
jgi:hypothetical protein